MRGILCPAAAARLLNSKKWFFQNFFPIVILHEFYISSILRHHWYFSVLITFWLEHVLSILGLGLCFGKILQISQKSKSNFGNVPLCKKSQSFFILVSPDITDTFPFWKNLDGSKIGAAFLCLGVGGAGQGKAVVAAFPVILHPETLRRGQRSRSAYSEQCSVAVSISLPSRSLVAPTRLETRTKESNMYASHWVD